MDCAENEFNVTSSILCFVTLKILDKRLDALREEKDVKDWSAHFMTDHRSVLSSLFQALILHLDSLIFDLFAHRFCLICNENSDA